MRRVASSRVKNPAETAIFTRTVRSCDVDEKGTLAYKPRRIVRDDPTRYRERLFMGPEMALFGPHLPDFTLNSTGKLPGQRRKTREADLSTQQTGAQAPSRLPCPSGHHRWPQGSRRPPRPRPQAFERLSLTLLGFHHGSAEAAGGFSRRCQWRAGE